MKTDDIMKIAGRVECVQPSPPRAVFDLASTLDDVVDLTLGDPDLPPPENVRAAACCAIMEGKTRYSANAGLKELRKAIALDAEKNLGFPVDPDREIIVTVGAMEASFLLSRFPSSSSMIVPKCSHNSQRHGLPFSTTCLAVISVSMHTDLPYSRKMRENSPFPAPLCPVSPIVNTKSPLFYKLIRLNAEARSILL
jgi:DNA-binding transcriptional MocR family regulator